MQSISQSLSRVNPDQLPYIPEPLYELAEVRSLPVAWVEKIFKRLAAQLGHKIADLYASVDPQDVKAEWGSAMADFHPEEIKRGLDACQTRVFAPTLGEFLRLCRPALDPETAWVEAVENRDGQFTWSHPAVRRTAGQMSWELRTSTFAANRRRWTMVLEREFAAGWEDPAAAPLRLRAPQKPAPECPKS